MAMSKTAATCGVYGCTRHAATQMEWPADTGKAPLLLCPEHEHFYKTIAGPHMTFAGLACSWCGEPGRLYTVAPGDFMHWQCHLNEQTHAARHLAAGLRKEPTA